MRNYILSRREGSASFSLLRCGRLKHRAGPACAVPVCVVPCTKSASSCAVDGAVAGPITAGYALHAAKTLILVGRICSSQVVRWKFLSREHRGTVSHNFFSTKTEKQISNGSRCTLVTRKRSVSEIYIYDVANISDRLFTVFDICIIVMLTEKTPSLMYAQQWLLGKNLLCYVQCRRLLNKTVSICSQ